MIIPDAMTGIRALTAATGQGGLPPRTRHYDERGLAALILRIATTNVYNRLGVTTRQVAGARG